MFTDGKPDLVILLLVTEPVAALRRYKHCLPTPLFTYQLSLIYHIAVYRSRNLGFDDTDIGLTSDNQSR